MHGAISHLPNIKAPYLTLAVTDAKLLHIKHKFVPLFNYAPRHKHE